MPMSFSGLESVFVPLEDNFGGTEVVGSFDFRNEEIKPIGVKFVQGVSQFCGNSKREEQPEISFGIEITQLEKHPIGIKRYWEERVCNVVALKEEAMEGNESVLAKKVTVLGLKPANQSRVRDESISRVLKKKGRGGLRLQKENEDPRKRENPLWI